MQIAIVGLAGAGRGRLVDELLVARVRVDRVDEALLDREPLVQHPHHRGEAVRGARCVRNHLVLRGVVDRVVHAEADHRVGVAARRRDDHALGPAGEVPRRRVARGEEAGRLDHDVDTLVGPLDRGGVLLTELLDVGHTRHRETRVGELHVLREFVAGTWPAAVVLDGQAGIGKTILWDAAPAMASAAEIRVLRCQPAAGEARLSFSALLPAITRLRLGVIEDIRGNPDRSRDHQPAVARPAEEIDDARLLALALSAVGLTATMRGEGVAGESRRAGGDLEAAGDAVT